mmetsp:Transcript_3721/g.11417  ORF Transcript_3721/g.11417 Transcript_3721/m.11417 type:complete len:450 (-) Transcript_3721:2066-3415(-)
MALHSSSFRVNTVFSRSKASWATVSFRWAALSLTTASPRRCSAFSSRAMIVDIFSSRMRFSWAISSFCCRMSRSRRRAASSVRFRCASSSARNRSFSTTSRRGDFDCEAVCKAPTRSFSVAVLLFASSSSACCLSYLFCNSSFSLRKSWKTLRCLLASLRTSFRSLRDCVLRASSLFSASVVRCFSTTRSRSASDARFSASEAFCCALSTANRHLSSAAFARCEAASARFRASSASTPAPSNLPRFFSASASFCRAACASSQASSARLSASSARASSLAASARTSRFFADFNERKSSFSRATSTSISAREEASRPARRSALALAVDSSFRRCCVSARAASSSVARFSSVWSASDGSSLVAMFWIRSMRARTACASAFASSSVAVTRWTARASAWAALARKSKELLVASAWAASAAAHRASRALFSRRKADNAPLTSLTSFSARFWASLA